MKDFWNDVLTFAETTTARVGTQLLEYAGQVQASNKPDGSLVTQADQWADKEIREAIASTFPDYGILSEEAEHTFTDAEWTWIIDPLDGTTNFTRGIPLWGVSLGLLYKGTPVFGYVHFPPVNQSFHGFWYGSSGLTGPTGAFMNNKPIHSSPDNPSNNHFFSLCARSTSVMRPDFPCKIRMLGVATYNFLAVGAGTALGGVEATPKIWDIAGSWAIIQAAGAVWVSLGSKPIFPLEVGQDYGNVPLPSLIVSREELVPVFEPLVRSVATR